MNNIWINNNAIVYVNIIITIISFIVAIKLLSLGNAESDKKTC
jgi:hypothetical protein